MAPERQTAAAPRPLRDRAPEEGEGTLLGVIRDEIQREGRLTFARFMELALYHPSLGYYSRRPDRGARGGDFLTAPEAHPLFGHTVARQLDEMWRLLDRPSRFTLRDYGAGSGALGESILRALRHDGSELSEAMRYEPVESSLDRLAAIRERLDAAGLASQLGDPDPGLPFAGCAIANEFLDAFPVHRVEVRDGRLREIFVGWRDGGLVEEPAEPSTPRIPAYFADAGVTLGEGQLAEVNLRAVDWIGRLALELGRGWALIVDYGHAAEELYGPKRPRGTLLGYRGHRVVDDPYASVGDQDLTSHVDFSALERAAHEAGLQIVGRTTQAEFLTGLGLGELFLRYGRDQATTAKRYAEARAAVVRLLDPRHLGGFKVLVLAKRVPSRGPLAGLSFRLAHGR